MSKNIDDKLLELMYYLKELKRVAVAFSGGVDSTLLLHVAKTALPKRRVKPLLVNTPATPESEIKYAIENAKNMKLNPDILTIDNVKIINENGNGHKRCYYCKKALFSIIVSKANSLGFYYVIEGTNTDDLEDYRPGIKALKELGIISPFIKKDLSKNEIRQLAKRFGLPVWDKPSSACLVSRFPYDVKITNQELQKVELAEDYLKQQGFSLCRVRNFGEKCVIEVNKDRIKDLSEIQDKIKQKLKSIGFNTVEIDENGYKTGNMDKS